MPQDEFKLFLAGDALIVTPWSQTTDPAMGAIFDEMRSADATVLNLETVVHSHRGYAQADSGGFWMSSPPEIASELAWAGVNMVAHANNHTFDYGSEGVLETIEHIEAAGVAISGSGRDLQQAREPKYFSTGGITVAHVAMASTFIPYGKASRTRPGIRGRPGLNPLTVDSAVEMTMPEDWFRQMESIDRRQGRDTRSYRDGWTRRRDVIFRPAPALNLRTLRQLKASDAKENLEAINAAANAADIVVVSIHCHRQANWLREFARQAISGGADVVLVHGPHVVRGIEIINGRPIFYCLGDFVFQSPKVGVLPSDAYEPYGLGDDATPDDWARQARRLRDIPKTYEGCAATVTFKDGIPQGVTIIPVDLGFGRDGPFAGHPRLADPALGDRLIGEMAQLSQPFGVNIAYDADRNLGRIRLTDATGEAVTR